MVNFNDIVIFKNKTFGDLLKEIYDNSKNKEKQITGLIQELRILITDSRDANIIAPLIKGYLDAGVKNDEHLIKLAALVQRIMTNTTEDGGLGLSDEEKAALMEEINNIEKEIKSNG